MGLGKAKNKQTRCCTICVVVMVVLLLVSLGGLSGTSYFLKKLVPFTDVGVLKTLTGCADCPACMACLTGITGEDVDELCDPLANIFQCVVQFVYLYGRPDYEQPCYDVCHPCEQCLETTTFRSLSRLEKTLWETTFPDFLDTPENMGYDNYSMECSENIEMCVFNVTEDSGNIRAKRQVGSDLCCGTFSHILPYTFEHTDLSGTRWYPVWFNIPWNNLPRQYQWYHDVKCLQADLSCNPSISCQTSDRAVTVLMSSKRPSRLYGFTYQLLVLPDKKVKFMRFHLPSYCHCVN